jgi:uncharacterized protein
MDELSIKSLLRPDAYPEPTDSVRLVQTHVSYIFITDNFAYKIKKPVDLGFLNFTSIDRRRFYCNEEVRLNRRLCPDLYLDVVELRESASGLTFCGEGTVVDYAVLMRRLPEERMLDRLLNEGKVTEMDIRNIAAAVAGFHLKADRGGAIDEYGTVSAILRNWDENFQQVGNCVGAPVSERDLSLIRTFVETFISENESVFAERLISGFIRDCDGDIHIENICMTDPPCIFDCIEFNDRFRYSDTAADIAFFLMDLDFHGKNVLSGPFIDEYCNMTGDRGLFQVLDFYMVYRAFVRGKVESLKQNTPDIPDCEKISAGKKAERYFRLARGYIIRKRMPKTLIITCGLMGSGKSTIASALAFELGLETVSSDAVRKEITNTPPDQHRSDKYGNGIYTPVVDESVYNQLFYRGEKAMKEGRSIIVDATFRRLLDRVRFAKMAGDNGASFYIVHTVCADSIERERLNARDLKPDGLSDGRWELFQPQKDDFEPPGNGEGKVISLDTSLPMADNINMILKSMEIYNGA